MITNKKKRTTLQKVKILEYLQSVYTHPTAEVVYEYVKKEIPMISLGTVYRNLNALADDNEIIRLEVNGEFRYDANNCGHVHLICTKCSSIEDKALREKFTFGKFNVHCYSLIVKGTCEKCSRRMK
ncbi:transcriptional repressor [Candidatus Woesearchaeota archaeon]|nr:transcriptional repressor [Candidatus Woesearchaeota archaeon]